MRLYFPILQAFLLSPLATINLFPAFGKKGIDPLLSPIVHCRLLGEVDSFAMATDYPGLTYTHTKKYEFSYDARGNWTGKTDSSFLQYSDGKNTVDASTDTKQYDASGYLVKEEFETRSLDRQGRITSSGRQINYQYDHGRLVKKAIVNSDRSHSDTQVFTYAYDPAGDLTLYAAPWDTAHYIYTNGALTGIREKDSNKQLHVFAVTTDAQGAILKISGDHGMEKDCQYDANGNMVEFQEWWNGKKTLSATSAYDSLKSPTLFEFPQNKGFPRSQYIEPYNYLLATPVNNLIMNSNQAMTGPQLQSTPHQVNYINTYDDHGNLVVQTQTESGGGAATLLPVKSIYTYTGCP